MISGQLKETIATDIFKKINPSPTKPTSSPLQNLRNTALVTANSYDNLITFLTNSFQYKYYDDKNINILDFLDSIGLEEIYNFFRKSNVFTCQLPRFELFYLNENNEISTISKNVATVKVNSINDIYNQNDIFILYTINQNIVRYTTVDNDPGYLQFNTKERLRKERLEKLEKLNEI